jgi:hypothetical protein
LNTLAYSFRVLILAPIHNLLMSIAEYAIYQFRHHRFGFSAPPAFPSDGKRYRSDG